MPNTYVLIEADEGNTDTVIVTPGDKTDLLKQIKLAYNGEIAKNKAAGDPVSISNAEYDATLRDALLEMVKNAPDTIGRHTLTSIQPHWQKWTLVITNGPFASLH